MNKLEKMTIVVIVTQPLIRDIQTPICLIIILLSKAYGQLYIFVLRILIHHDSHSAASKSSMLRLETLSTNLSSSFESSGSRSLGSCSERIRFASSLA